MANGDYGYFGKGDTGYAQYMTAFNHIYSTVIPSAPYIIAAYALLWVALLVYLLMIARGTKKAQAQLQLLEEAMEDVVVEEIIVEEE